MIFRLSASFFFKTKHVFIQATVQVWVETDRRDEAYLAENVIRRTPTHYLVGRGKSRTITAHHTECWELENYLGTFFRDELDLLENTRALRCRCETLRDVLSVVEACSER